MTDDVWTWGDKIHKFWKRMDSIDIQVEIMANYPWIYLRKVNGNLVKEKYLGNHGFTIMFAGKNPEFTNIEKMFEIIRKYK